MGEIRFSSAVICDILNQLRGEICPFTFTQDGRDYTVLYHQVHGSEFYVTNHGYWKFSDFARWFGHGDLINGKRFEEFYSEFSRVDVSGMEDLL